MNELILRAMGIIAERQGLGQLSGILLMLADRAASGGNVENHMKDVATALKGGQEIDLNTVMQKINEESDKLHNREKAPVTKEQQAKKDAEEALPPLAGNRVPPVSEAEKAAIEQVRREQREKLQEAQKRQVRSQTDEARKQADESAKAAQAEKEKAAAEKAKNTTQPPAAPSNPAPSTDTEAAGSAVPKGPTPPVTPGATQPANK